VYDVFSGMQNYLCYAVALLWFFIITLPYSIIVPSILNFNFIDYAAF